MKWKKYASLFGKLSEFNAKDAIYFNSGKMTKTCIIRFYLNAVRNGRNTHHYLVNCAELNAKHAFYFNVQEMKEICIIFSKIVLIFKHNMQIAAKLG